MPELNGFQLRYYESVMDSIPCGTLALNSELVIASINPAAEQILGLKMQKSIGFPLPDLLNPLLGSDRTQKLEVRLKSLLRQRFSFSYELIFADRIVALKASPLVEPQQPVMGVVLVLEDITERRRAEERIHQQLTELQRWYGVTLTRETRALELKGEINTLLRRLSEPIRYPSAEYAA
jgi:PAS domain S-box-containing protein